AASRALLRGRLRYRLDAQLLDLVAIAVALHAREPRVDDVAHARHGERGLGDVRREDDAASRVLLEDAFLLRGGKACVERQDLGVRRMVLAQRLGGLADLAFARE